MTCFRRPPYRFSLLSLALVALAGFTLAAPALAADTNGLGFSLAVDQAPVASHARMQSPAGMTVEVVSTDQSAIAPTAAAGLTAFVGIFGPFSVPAASAMSFWLMY